MSGFGVYVHFPYCQQRCPYCDFAVAVRKTIPHERYRDAVLHELLAKQALFPGRRLRSLYFGGGTPSLWRSDCLAAVSSAVRAAFPAEAPELEVTVEADPAQLGPEALSALRAAGVNRLSIGAQSLDGERLKWLGRQHTPAAVLRSVGEARAAGFDNLSLDLLIGLPGQTEAELDVDLDGLLALAPEHLSLYQLTVEEGTALHKAVRRGTTRMIDSERQAALYGRVQERLDAAGLAQYEISSFARRQAGRDRRAVHNRLYWTGGEYLGLGLSAHSFRKQAGLGERFANGRGLEAYLSTWSARAEFELGEGGRGLALYEQRQGAAYLGEQLWLGLRLLDGVSLEELAREHGDDPARRYARELESLTARGLVARDGPLVRLTRQGVLFADEVGASFL